MSPNATLIFVPGAWHSPSTWNKIISLLEIEQYKCIPIALPSATPNPSVTFLDDITAVRNAILGETLQGRNVVVVVHSYGGAVGSSAIKGLARPKQDISTSSPQSATGHVLGLVMLASGGPPTGVGFIEALGGQPPPSWKAETDSGFAVLAVEPRELFYHDLPAEEGNYWVGKLESQSLKALMEGGGHSYAGWLDVPVWYLATTTDRAFPIEAQRMFAPVAREMGADVTLREIESGHSVMLSRPKETAEFIVEAVRAFGR